MIQANAKCVVNGKKLNELISWINGSMEQLDVVDQNNYASKRWFLVSDASDINSGTSPDASRDKMPREGGGGGGGGAQGNRDKLNKAAGGGQGVKIKNGGALRDDGSTAEDSRRKFLANKKNGASPSDIDFSKTDEFGNVIGIGGKGMAGALRDDGSTAEDSRRKFLANKKNGASPSGAFFDDGGQPTAPPRVGATPPNATEKEPADIRGKERSNKQSDFKGKASDFEKQRRALEKLRNKSRQSKTETFLQDLATKKRQAFADRERTRSQLGGKYSPYARGPR